MSLRSFFSMSDDELSSTLILRRALFLLLLFGLMLFYLAPGFKGLTHYKGKEQAQIARELARNGSFQTKMIRPLSLHQADQNNEDLDGVHLVGFHDTYHAPLNPMINSLVMRFFKGKNDFKWDRKDTVYYLDRVITATSIIFLLASIGITFLFISRVFDAKIGGVTAVLMLLCELLWRFSQTGLPQMLMLFLFTLGSYSVFRAVEAQCMERKPIWFLLFSALCFGLLALTHWLAVWPFVGLVIFSCFYFKPRGTAAFSMLAVFLVIILPWCLRNLITSGSIFGSGYYAMFGGMGAFEEEIYRTYNRAAGNIFAEGFASKVLKTSLNQLNGIYAFLGSIAVAPLFFISLLHPFKRPQIAAFRWFILAMWIPAVIGMSLFGLDMGSADPNQLHLLFIPLMTGYGIAMLAILWSRIGIAPSMKTIADNGHLWIAIVISTVPMILNLIPGVPRALGGEKEKPTQGLLVSHIRESAEPEEVVVTDSPWDVAWYGDRTALWLPTTKSQLREIMKRTEKNNNPISGILITRESLRKPLAYLIYGNEKEWGSLILGQNIFMAGASRSKVQPKSWMPSGKGLINSFEGLPFTEPDQKMSSMGYFYYTNPNK